MIVALAPTARLPSAQVSGSPAVHVPWLTLVAAKVTGCEGLSVEAHVGRGRRTGVDDLDRVDQRLSGGGAGKVNLLGDQKLRVAGRRAGRGRRHRGRLWEVVSEDDRGVAVALGSDNGRDRALRQRVVGHAAAGVGLPDAAGGADRNVRDQ